MKIKSTLVVLLFFACANSDAQVNIGLFGGLNYSRNSLKDLSLTMVRTEQDMSLNSVRDSRHYYRNSFYGGIKFDIQLANSLLLSPKLLVESTGYQENFIQHFYNGLAIQISDSIGGKDIVRLTYLSLPVHLVFQAPLGKARIFVGAGGFVSVGLTGQNDFQKDFSTFPVIDDSVKAVTFSSAEKFRSDFFHARRLDYGISVTLGIQFRQGLFLEAMLENGFQDVFTDKYTVYDSNKNPLFVTPNKRRIIMVGIGYRFNRPL